MAFGQLLAPIEVVGAFAIQLGLGQGMLKSPMEDITKDARHPLMKNVGVGPAAVVVVDV